MTLFLLNIVLAFIWAAINGTFSIASVLIGFLLGYIIIWIASPVIDHDDYHRKLWLIVALIFYFLKELFISSLRVAKDVLTPGEFKMKSGIVALPLEVKSDFAITFLANMISLTPGTLSLDVSEDRSKLFIHAMYIDNGDVESVRRELKNGMEQKVITTFGR
ncbi:MAG: multicomponent Na+:H+ antiporter subunit MnhE [Bacteroidetes bacterium HLUCCA01]|nr:MAG: multicomponent Na+:H+ antiporter subunit MnhE [Bacteroidetes bacterium HLUCCA01]